MNKNQFPYEANHFYQDHVLLLLVNYQRLFKHALLESVNKQDLGRQVFAADFALLSHNYAPDPLFNYANRTALDLFEMSWSELIGMPSRLSAEPATQQEREHLLTKVAEQGFIENYSSVRISKTGRRFQIQGARIWNVHDEQGHYHGQAACFKDWVWL
jgi:hypothetical protein